MTEPLTRFNTVRLNPELLNDYLTQFETRGSDQANRTGLRLSSTVMPEPIRDGEDVPKWLQRLNLIKTESL